jgi:hypothetical protein
MERRSLKAAALLTVLCVGGAAAALPLMMAIAAAAQSELGPAPMPTLLLVVLALVQASVLFAIASFAGMALATRLGLRPQILMSLVDGERLPHGTTRLLLGAAAIGAGLGAVLFALDAWLFGGGDGEISRMVGDIALWKRLLAGVFYGGINEEVLMRLFLVSLVACLLARAWRRDAAAPRAGVMWSAILLVALLFGLGHLPAASMVGELTPALVTRVIVLNTVAGLVFGWLFWRRGLEAAMVAHATAHLPMQVLATAAA